MYILSILSYMKVPTITDLRNPALKPRHWAQIAEVIGHDLDPEAEITLNTLTEMNVFDHMEAIQEVSGQASSESSLESILKKVCVYNVCVYVHTCTHTMQVVDTAILISMRKSTEKTL